MFDLLRRITLHVSWRVRSHANVHEMHIKDAKNKQKLQVHLLQLGIKRGCNSGLAGSEI